MNPGAVPAALGDRLGPEATAGLIQLFDHVQLLVSVLDRSGNRDHGHHGVMLRLYRP